MFDKRIQRGNTYAAMVIPAGTSHDTMISEKRQTQKAQSMGRRTFKSTKVSTETDCRERIQKDVTIMTGFFLLFDNRPQSASFPSTRIATFPPQSPSWAGNTSSSKLTSTLRT